MPASVDYEVRISQYPSARNMTKTTITFRNGADKKIPYAYVRVWAKGNRLYFLSGAPSDYSFGADGTVCIQSAKLADALKPYIGEYNTLEYDEVTRYYYVDANNKTAEREYANRGNRIGMKYPPRETKPHIDKVTIRVADEVAEAVEILESKPLSAPVETPKIDQRHKEWYEAAQAICKLHGTDVIGKQQYDELRLGLLDKIICELSEEVGT